MPVSAAYQCPSVPPISAHWCRLSVPISVTYQCQTASQCCLSVSVSAAYQ
ncbi:unnamed protein product [Staurois parvus]|uniref:Uncharacterized protein n=1 Tax=Staurois parvus TaxID=386267 RepID=A0ABN9CI33_9NEOB|nr:unnamed protein product [Staurois parvus]